MSISEILGISGGGLVVLLTLIQISPIKFNPWSRVFACFGRLLNAEVIKRLDQIEKEFSTVKKQVKAVDDRASEREAVCCRVRILRFGDELLHGQRHSREHFEQVLLDVTDYNNYCRSHPEFKNGVTEVTTERIREDYKNRLKNNDFLL